MIQVAIIGDGVTGLCMSLALSRQCVSHKVFASASSETHRPIWTLGPNAIHALQAIHPSLEEWFWEHATFDLDPRWGRWFSLRLGMARMLTEEGSTVEGQTERLPLLVDVEADGPYAKGRGCIHQDDLLQQIRALNGANEMWANKVVEIRECDSGIELRMEDGSTRIADLVLACDGADGPARRWVASSEFRLPMSTPSGYWYEMTVPWQESESCLGHEVVRNGNIFVGRHGYITSTPVEYDNQRWLHVVAVRQSLDQARIGGQQNHHCRPEDLLQDFEGWAAPLRALLGSVKSIPVRHKIANYQADLPYHRGRVCLLGEAAHPITLHECSSAGMNLEDVALMSRLWPTVHPETPWAKSETIFQVFDAVRQERTGRAMETAYWAGRLLQMNHPDVGDDLAVVSLNACHRWNWMWTYDVQWDVRRAVHKLQQLKTTVEPSKVSPAVIPQLAPRPADADEWEHDFEELNPVITSLTSMAKTRLLDSDLESVEYDKWLDDIKELL